MSSIDLVAYRPILDVVDNFVFASNTGDIGMWVNGQQVLSVTCQKSIPSPKMTMRPCTPFGSRH